MGVRKELAKLPKESLIELIIDLDEFAYNTIKFMNKQDKFVKLVLDKPMFDYCKKKR